MSLSPSNALFLKALSNFDEERVRGIADATLQCLVDPAAENGLEGDECTAQYGLASLLALSARQMSSPESVESALVDSGLSGAAAGYISKLYGENVEKIRDALSQYSISPPKIAKCNWRLDYAVSDSETGSILSPLFFVELETEEGGHINFTCTEEEMTALVGALKEATEEAARTTL